MAAAVLQSEKEISFQRLLQSCQRLLAEEAHSQSLTRPYAHKIITQYLQTLTVSLNSLEADRKAALTCPIDTSTTGHNNGYAHAPVPPIPSAEALLEYRRKLNSFLYLADTARMSLLVAEDKRNLHVLQNTALYHDPVNPEIEVRNQVQNAVHAAMKDILFEEHKTNSTMATTTGRAFPRKKKRDFKGSLISEILEGQEKLREDTTEEMLELVKGIKGVHERVHKNIKKDNEDIETLGDALGLDVETTAHRAETLGGLLHDGTSSLLLYWGLIFFVLASFFSIYIFMKLFPK